MAGPFFLGLIDGPTSLSVASASYAEPGRADGRTGRLANQGFPENVVLQRISFRSGADRPVWIDSARFRHLDEAVHTRWVVVF